MIVMLSNDSSAIIHYWAGRYPGKVGWLFGPSNRKNPPPWLPYACDNDAFAAWKNKTPWDEDAFFRFLDWCRLQPVKPLWVIVPDVVGDKVATLEHWRMYAPKVAKFGWPLAFAVQDGMKPSDVPSDANIIFVGGTDRWKWRNVRTWPAHFERVHVGRVNAVDKLSLCEELGIESIDGTGWFRKTYQGKDARKLAHFIEGHRPSKLQGQLLHA